ncbi:MAG: FecR domain-containing protein [Planctomycetes bacterium]|nr:FecR domain-containing protein [Planctomycetota bacterium]
MTSDLNPLGDDELALLVDHYLDGELSPVDRSRLTSDMVLARRFIAELRFQGRVGGLLKPDGRTLLGQVEDALALDRSTELADRVLAKLPERRRPVSWWRLAAGTALAASLIAVISLVGSGSFGSGSFGNTPNGVTAAVADGVNAPSEPRTLKTGALLTLDVNQEAQVAFTDGTRMDLGATSAVRLSGIDQGGARIALENGSLSAEVTKQPKGSHFQVQTKEALLTVLGTKFTATKYPWGTRVEVTEGRVRTKRETDDKEVEVGAGSRVDVGPGPMDLQPIRPPLPTEALVLEPIADSVVVGGKYGNENRGTRPGHVVTSPKTRKDELRDYYLRFDLTQVREAPSSAKLHLHLTLLKRRDLKLHLARVDSSWGETTITWNNRPPLGENVAEWTPDRQDSPIDLTAFVTTNLGKVVDLCLHIDEAEKPDAIVGFHTREAAPILRPRLVIEQ